jgi:hypothetical protein
MLFTCIISCKLSIVYIIYGTGSKFLSVGSIKHSNINEPAVEPVRNDWTNEPLNRQLHQFDGRSDPNNYAYYEILISIS